MRSKLLCFGGLKKAGGALLRALLLLPAVFPARADSPIVRYLGSPSCASSSCHGGAGERRSQHVQWSAHDVHRRANATLTLARSTQIGLALKEPLRDPVNSPRCTVCHAPVADVPAELRLTTLDRTEGVACETCHAPAESWIRSHTRTELDRPPFHYADKVAGGLRDLRNLYVRANTCVACHENVDRDLLEAGHPELVFELDGQSVGEPKHWREKPGFNGAQAWLVGQAVAWREVVWQATKPEQGGGRPSGQGFDALSLRHDGLKWVVSRAAAAIGVTGEDPDAIARSVAARSWTDADTAAVLKVLAGSAAELKAAGNLGGARPAERLVLALDRLLAAGDPARERKVAGELAELFRLVQSPQEFSAQDFSAALEKFAAAL